MRLQTLGIYQYTIFCIWNYTFLFMLSALLCYNGFSLLIVVLYS